MASSTRDRMIDGALKLLAEKGLQRASFHEVTKATNTPRGSIYYHFPGGKSELVKEALHRDGVTLTEAFDEIPAPSPRAFLEGIFTWWERYLTEHEFNAGCATAAVVMAVEDDVQAQAAREKFESMLEYLAKRLRESGLEDAEADRLARVTMVTFEGAILMARAAGDLTTYRAATSSLLETVSA